MENERRTTRQDRYTRACVKPWPGLLQALSPAHGARGSEFTNAPKGAFATRRSVHQQKQPTRTNGFNLVGKAIVEESHPSFTRPFQLVAQHRHQAARTHRAIGQRGTARLAARHWGVATRGQAANCPRKRNPVPGFPAVIEFEFGPVRAPLGVAG